MLYNNEMKKKGQILLITLLVITILSIITLTTVVFVAKDIKQVSQNNQYQQSYNVAENQLQQVLNNYSNPSKTLSSLIKDPLFSNCTNNITNSVNGNYEVDCISQNDTTFSSFPTDTTLAVIDSEQISNYIIIKDNSLDLNLSKAGQGYTGGINLSWDQSIAVDFAGEGKCNEALKCTLRVYSI